MSSFQQTHAEEQKVQKKVMDKITSGDYNENLALSMRHAAAAVAETSTSKEQYLLAQSQAQSLIAIVLLLEDIAGYIMGEQQ